MIELVGDLGAGKTTFVQLLLRELGYEGEVSSPTFTVHRSYPIKNEQGLHHFDFYRIGGEDVVTQEIQELMAQPGEIVCIEWADQGAGELPSDRLRIELEQGDREGLREVTLTDVGGKHAELVQEVKDVFGN